MAASTELTPEEWLDFLEPLLTEQQARIQPFGDYYDGNQQMNFATQKFTEAFGTYYKTLANNWMQIVVDAPVSRLEIQGFRFSSNDPDTPNPDKTPVVPTPPPGPVLPPEVQPAPAPVQIAGQTPPWELTADDDAWSIWQSNNLDSISRMVHTDAVKLSVSYLLVGEIPEGKKWPRITPEHAKQVYVYCDPEDRNNRLAAIKIWIDDFSGDPYCDIYLPNEKVRFVGEKEEGRNEITWTRRTDVPNVVANTAGVVPMIPIENKPDLLTGPHSDLENAIPLQDMINKYCLDMQVSSEFHAFPQRWASGWSRAVDDRGREMSGREVELYLSASRVIRSEDKETRFGNFQQGDVQNYIAPIEMLIDHLAVQTQTPLYYLKGKMSATSADAVHAQDQGLVDRCSAKILSFSDGWEEVMRTAFLMMGDEQKGNAESTEVLWAAAESKSLAVLAQAAVLMRQNLSLPLEFCWQMLGFSPAQIRLARDLMGLPPGGGPVKPAMMPGSPSMDLIHDPEENDPEAHPGNQKGQPSGQAAYPRVRGRSN